MVTVKHFWVSDATIKEEFEPHGRAEYYAAHNACLSLATPPHLSINANEDEIEWYGNNNEDDGIIAVNYIPPEQGDPIPLIDNSEESDDDECSDSDNEDNDDYALNHMNDVPAVKDEDITPPSTKDDISIPCVHRSKCKTRGQMSKYAKYGLMMAARWWCQGGNARAIIREGMMFFSATNINDAKQIPIEYQMEWL